MLLGDVRTEISAYHDSRCIFYRLLVCITLTGENPPTREHFHFYRLLGNALCLRCVQWFLLKAVWYLLFIFFIGSLWLTYCRHVRLTCQFAGKVKCFGVIQDLAGYIIASMCPLSGWAYPRSTSTFSVISYGGRLRISVCSRTASLAMTSSLLTLPWGLRADSSSSLLSENIMSKNSLQFSVILISSLTSWLEANTTWENTSHVRYHPNTFSPKMCFLDRLSSWCFLAFLIICICHSRPKIWSFEASESFPGKHFNWATFVERSMLRYVAKVCWVQSGFTQKMYFVLDSRRRVLILACSARFYLPDKPFDSGVNVRWNVYSILLYETHFLSDEYRLPSSGDCLSTDVLFALPSHAPILRKRSCRFERI